MARHLEEEVQHWRKAQDWLYSTGKLSQPHGMLLDFAMGLVDGAVLCEVANFLHPGAIRSFTNRPLIQFMCVKNIDNFLNACIKFFGFQTHELFTATELLEVENFEKVVEVLSKLSQTNQARAAGLQPFYCYSDNQELYHTLQREAESRSEDIYSRIEEIFPFERTLDYSYQDNYQQESIYEDIVKIKQYRMDKPNDKRGYMIDELFETEKNYVQVLEIVITHFLEKLKITLKNEDIKIIFQNIEELKKIHEKLLQRLKLSIDNGGLNIGECFKKTMQQFYKYGNYCACLDIASEKIDELMSDSKMANLINRCSQESKQRFSLKDLLKVPAQRILKYHMLLENLHKVSPDNSSLEEGFRIMKALASFINEYKRNFEQKLATKSIEERIQNIDEVVDLYAYGTLLKDGEVMLKHTNKPVKRFAFLFERCVLICKKFDSNSNLEIQVPLDFETYEIAEEFFPPSGSKFSFGWSMKNKTDILVPHYQIFVKTSEQCSVWLAKLREGYNLLRSPTYLKWEHNFCLNNFPENTKCGGCDEILSGVFVQGLFCQSCNLACHRHCKTRVPDCKKPKTMGRGSSYTNKDLPSLPTTSSFISTGYNIPDAPDFHSTHTDGAPPTPNATSPPPIPPRVPSLKIDSETADSQSEEAYENMVSRGPPSSVQIPGPAKNFYSLDPLEKQKHLDGHGRRSIPSTPTSNSRSPSFDRVSPQQFVTIQADLFVCTKDYNGAPISNNFEPTIVLNRAEFVEVINKDHPMYWKGKSQASGLVGYFPSENVKLYSSQSVSSPVVVPSPTLRQQSNGSQLLYNYPWYVGAMDRNGGRMMLEPATVPDGCYLVRESKRGPGQFAIDVKFNFMVKHIKVVYIEGVGYSLAPSKTFNSIVELVTHYQRSTLGQVFRDLQTKLTVPYRCLPGS